MVLIGRPLSAAVASEVARTPGSLGRCARNEVSAYPFRDVAHGDLTLLEAMKVRRRPGAHA